MNAFAPDVVAAITRHMNDDHADDSLLICRTLGGQKDAVAARVDDVDGEGITFAVETAHGNENVRLAWSRTLTERKEVREEIVRLHGLAKEHIG